jgi:hypothetical protein
VTDSNSSGWQGLMRSYGVSDATAARLIRSLTASEVAGLEQPLGRYLLELEPQGAEGRSWYGEPGPGEVVTWDAVLKRAGVVVAPHRVAHAYLELAVLVRALEGLSDSARIAAAPDRDSLWAGLFDLRENLLDGALDDLRALAA